MGCNGKMLFLIVVVTLVASPCLAEDDMEEYDLDGDANIYRPVLESLLELEAHRTQEQDDPQVHRASSVCYDQLGCFDKEGTFKHVKQLPEPPETVNTQFLLYTRKNRQVPQFLDYRKPETILESNFDPSKPIKIATHGFGGRSNLTWLWNMKSAFLEMHDVNVIVIDWSLGARTPYYIQASVNSELVGAEAAVLFFFLKDRLGVTEAQLHLVGFSLGAQVVGFIGKRMKTLRGTRPARISGLDPASPLFEDYGGEVHLYKDDADLVDVIHTNADLLLYGGVGMGIPIGHIDFYPNGGKRQPGCGSTLKGAFQDMFNGDQERTCNHERAVHLYTDSILNPDSGCRYVAHPCTNYTEFSSAKCMGCEGRDCGHMGYDVKGEGIYYLMTKAKKPFCSELAKLTVDFSKEAKKSYGIITITILGAGGVKENVTLTEKDEKLLPGSSRTVAIALGQEMWPPQSVEALYVRYNGWIVKGTQTYALGPISIEDKQGNTVFKSCEENVVLTDNQYKTISGC